MSFLELHMILQKTGRYGLGFSILLALLDEFDEGNVWVGRERITDAINNHHQGNVSAVATLLIEVGFLQKQYDKWSTTPQKRVTYALTDPVLELFRRKKNSRQ